MDEYLLGVPAETQSLHAWCSAEPHPKNSRVCGVMTDHSQPVQLPRQSPSKSNACYVDKGAIAEAATSHIKHKGGKTSW